MDSGAPITEGHMVMGVKDATITSVVEQLKGTYSIYGENFTKQSKVYINGEKQTTKFLNNTRLDLKESKSKMAIRSWLRSAVQAIQSSVHRRLMNIQEASL